jgi:nucleotide-binding universal stress UspA family protein
MSMYPIRTIVLATDYSNSAKLAAAHAIGIARRHKATLHVLHVVSELESDPHSPVRFSPESAGRHESHDKTLWELIESSIKGHDIGDIHVELVNRRYPMSIAGGIITYATAANANLIVMGTHGRRGLHYFMLGSVASGVVRRSTCNVFVVPAADEDPTHLPKIRKILVPLDYSEYSKSLLETSLLAARATGAKLDILHVIEPLPFPVSLTGMMSVYDVLPRIRERSEECLNQYLNDLDGGDVESELFIEDGHAANTIVKFVDEHDEDVVIVATHGLSGVKRFLIGSVTDRVVRGASCPVLVVKPTEQDQDDGDG